MLSLIVRWQQSCLVCFMIKNTCHFSRERLMWSTYGTWEQNCLPSLIALPMVLYMSLHITYSRSKHQRTDHGTQSVLLNISHRNKWVRWVTQLSQIGESNCVITQSTREQNWEMVAVVISLDIENTHRGGSGSSSCLDITLCNSMASVSLPVWA